MALKKPYPKVLNRSSEGAYVLASSGVCSACGGYGPYSYIDVINPELSSQWNLSKEQSRNMSARESMYCMYCGCSYRLRLLARAINYWLVGDAKKSLLQSIEDGALDTYKIAEINSCGVLHELIKDLDNLSYSEYGPSDQSIRNENLLKLSYADKQFDIVLTSDVLEHVPDVSRSLAEIYRVLKPGGAHIFTVPIVQGRPTKQRLHLEDGKKVSMLPYSFHGSGEHDYLVWTEFGDDFIETVQNVGFGAYYAFINDKKKTDMTGIIIAIKPGGTKKELPQEDEEDKVNLEWQLKRLQYIVNKIMLTNNHIANLESMNKNITKDNKQLRDINRELTKEVERLNRKSLRVLGNLAKRVFIRVKHGLLK